VGFTRNPSTGDKEFYGEFLMNAQGEDVVAGIRTPHPIADLEAISPEAYTQLKEITTSLEKHYKDMQDFEFTIQEGKLYMLQTRNGKRTGHAAVRVAVEMVGEGMIDKKEAVTRVAPSQLDQLMHPVFDTKTLKTLTKLTNAISASPGAAVGRVAFTAEEAVEMAPNGPVLLVRKETTPDDIHGMDVAKGILTAIGGKSSHAAVVARGMGRPCVVGASGIRIDEAKKIFTTVVDGKTITVKEGDFVYLKTATPIVVNGDFVVPVAAPADFNPTATLDDSTPCGATCTSDKFFAAFFGKSVGYTNSTSYAWQFFYTTPNDAHGHWADTDHTTAGDSSNGDIHN